MTRSLSRWLYPPLMLVGFNAAAIALIAGGRSHLLLAPLLAAAVAVSFAAERLIPYNAAWNDGYDDRARDVAHALVNEGCATISVLALPALASIATLADVWPRGFPSSFRYLGRSSSSISASHPRTGSATAGDRCGACTPYITRSSAPTGSTAS
jgi:hypothetical protein